MNDIFEIDDYVKVTGLDQLSSFEWAVEESHLRQPIGHIGGDLEHMTNLMQLESSLNQYINFLGIPIEQQEFTKVLKHKTKLREICLEILKKKIIQKAVAERGVIVRPDDIQAEADRIRREHQLERASDTMAWLNEQLLTPEEWEASIRDRLLQKQLQEHLFGPDIERNFVQNKLNFEQVVLYQIIVSQPQLAQEIFYQLEENEISFYEAAHLYNQDAKYRYSCGYMGSIDRRDLHPDLAAPIFSQRSNSVIGPIPIDQHYYLVKVEEFIPATLTPENRQKILTQLFQEWLDAEVNYLIHQQSSVFEERG